MANHRADVPAQIRPLKVATGTRRAATVSTGAMKVSVLGVLATATIGMPLANAATGEQLLDPESLKTQLAADGIVTDEAPVEAEEVAIPEFTDAAGLEVRDASAVASRDADREAVDGATDEAAEGEQSEREGASEVEATVENDEETGFSIALPEPEVIDESGNVLGSAGSDDYIRPAAGPIISGYGYRIHPVLGYRKFHDGIDIAAACGVPVRAAQSGTVTFAAYKGPSGKRVDIDHGNGTSTGYFHLQSYAVGQGETVEQGQVIGYVGTTGRSTGCHLHYAAMDSSGSYFDPTTILP